MKGDVGEISDTLVYSPNPSAHQDQGWSRLIGFNFGLPCWLQRHNYLSHYLLPIREHTSRKLESGADPGVQPRHSEIGCMHLNDYTKCLPLEGRVIILIFKIN